MNTPSKPNAQPAHLSQLDALTGGAFTAPTSGDRAARLREWLATEPTYESMADVFKELSHRDKGAAKALKEKLDDIKRLKAQEAIAEEWAAKAQVLLAQPRLNLADAMAWQRDAAKAGAPLSREPLSDLKTRLAERMKGLEDLQHRAQVEREAAVLLAQRIELHSTKPWREAMGNLEALKADVIAWQQHVQALHEDTQWDSLEPRYATQLDTAKQQLGLVWEAFEAALQATLLASEDASAPLPAVPVWADEVRESRGESLVAPEPAVGQAELTARKVQAAQVVQAALEALQREVAQGHTKTIPKAGADLRAMLKEHGRYIGSELDAAVHAALVQAGELEGWQRWRADQLREELVAKAQGLTQAPEGQTLGGRKMQEALRQLREQWKATDQGGVPNHALWKKFDEACNQAYKVVEAWLSTIKEQNQQHKAQRMVLVDEVRAWTVQHAASTDWKLQQRELHAFAERWRQCGHLSEKAFAELQPLWKEVMQAAHAPLEAAQAASRERRQALINDAVALGQATPLRIDAVKALQQRWQQEAHSVPVDRKLEQKLWEAFRKPIDEAFDRKTTEREKSAAALNEHDRAVLEASKALEAANASGDAQQIRSAVQALQLAVRGQAAAQTAAHPANAEAASAPSGSAAEAPVSAESAEPAAATEPTPEAAKPAVVPKKLVAMRGDDRPGMQKATPAQPGRGFGAKPGERRDARPPRDDRAPRGTDRFDNREARFEPRGPRLGDGAFRAQRDALEHAELALKKLAAQAHGEVVTQLLGAWEKRDPAAIPQAQALGGKLAAQGRSHWVQVLRQAGPAGKADQAAQALLRLEMAAEVPTPADQLAARRMLQLQLLTRRNDPAPAETWPRDLADVLAQPHDGAAARRLQNVLKVLLRK
ncbi:MAG: hypothetical protein RI959_1069 [Pseudomonadota bacterium]